MVKNNAAALEACKCMRMRDFKPPSHVIAGLGYKAEHKEQRMGKTSTNTSDEWN